MEDKKSNITIRLPESALEIFRARAAKSGEAVSKVVADACVSVIETSKLMDERQAMPEEVTEVPMRLTLKFRLSPGPMNVNPVGNFKRVGIIFSMDSSVIFSPSRLRI